MGLPGQGRAIVTRGQQQHQLRAYLALVGCALAIAACGSSNKPGAPGPSGGASTIATLDKYSACMRDHGVSGFPDPSTTETPNSFGMDGYNFDLPATMDTQSPAYESAQTTCGKLVSTGSGSSPPAGMLAKAREAALKRAECMRKHGVPNFPDPTGNGNGNGITESSAGGSNARMSPQSPTFQQAEKICGGA
jgi:hypothetical protein